MIRNYLLIALRSFLKQRTQSILNVLGLAIGLACSMYVFLYVHDELAYDTQHPDPDNTYRLVCKAKGADNIEQTNSWALVGWAHYLKENLEGVRGYSSIVRAGWPHSFYVPKENGEERIVLSEDVGYVMENYTDFFYLDLIEGDKETIFSQPTDILISASAAKELFGNESAMNKQIQVMHINYPKKIDAVIKGIFRDLPYNMQFGRTTKYLFNREMQRPMFEKWNVDFKWNNSLTALWWPAYGANIYVQVNEHTDLNVLQEKLKTVIEKAANVNSKEYISIDPYFLKITESHFSDIPGLLWPEMTGKKQYLYIFLTIGMFIMLISCINYINLATARSARRTKEVGMRKALGSYKSQLVFQFLQESFLLTGISIMLAILIAVLALPYFNAFSNKDFIALDMFTNKSLMFIFSLWIMVSILSGLYPAFYISSFNPVKILKGFSYSGKGGATLRKALIVFQFSVSLVLLVFTLVVISQMTNMINNDLNKVGNQILSIRYGNYAPENKLNVFKEELAKDPELSISSFGNHLPRREGFTPLNFKVTLPDKDDKKFEWEMMCVGSDFPKLYDLELIAGKLFDNTVAMDSMEVLVNEEVARQLNTDVEKLVGQTFLMKDDWNNKDYNFKIRGVVKNFKYKSVYNKISPLVLSLQKDRAKDIIYYVKLPAGKIQEKIAVVENVWKKVMPEDVGMSHWFLKDEFNRLYFEENALYDLSRVFTLLGIITTCIGLFGMSMFMAERRGKEMAIRKVMGASSFNVSMLMINSFLKLLGVACLIGLPVSYYVSTKWLNNFVYKAELNGLIIVASIGIILMATIFTISFQSFKIANSNPVNSLKQE